MKETDRLVLVPFAPRDLLALADDPARFAETFGRPAADGLRAFVVSDDASPEWRAGLRAADEADPWVHGFAVVDRESDTAVGVLGYKGPPDRDGVVEVAYAVVPAVEGRGYATEALEAGVEIAFAHPAVRTVRAHTLPEPNASTRVLTKAGFRHLGAIDDPDDGPVWRWEREGASADEIAAAEAYESLFVPALFGEWAPRIADAAAIRPGARVLDVACGTGVLAREAAARVGPSGRVVGVDPGRGMLAVGLRLAPAIEWVCGTAESLPFEDGSFDTVASQFGLMVFADPVAGLRQMRRVLADGGRLVTAVWSGADAMPAYAAEIELLERLAGRAAADALRVPFSLGERERLLGIFAAAGMPDVEVTTLRGTGRFAGPRAMVEADLRGWLPVLGVSVPEATIARILDEAERVLSPHVAGDGSFETSVELATVAA